MKQKLLTIILAVSCVAASCLPNILTNSKSETYTIETIALEESSDEASWGEIYKDADAYQKAYEESVAAYQQQMQDILNNSQNANLTQLYQEAQKAQAGKNVKDIDFDGYGKIKVSYANGQSKTINVLQNAPSSAGAVIPTVTPTPAPTTSVDSAFLFNDGGNGTELIAYNGNDYNVIIPDKCTKIGSKVFQNKPYIINITIPDSVTSIGYNAFNGCSGLTSITIPNSVTSIEDGAFAYCSSLTSITIPNSVTSIVDYVFSGCSSLTSITIPNSVTSIGSSAFWNCSGLTSITIPNSVTSIGSSAFNGCSSLTSITIPDSVTSIGGAAFYGCSGLTSITIPNSVTSIGYRAFWDCSGLTSITYNGITYTNSTDLFAALHSNGVDFDEYSIFYDTSF